MFQTTGSLAKTIILLVVVCMIGSSFHLHQFPSSSLSNDYPIGLHLDIDTPDCIACMNFLKATPPGEKQGLSAQPLVEYGGPSNYKLHVEYFMFDLNNKSPPLNGKRKLKLQLFLSRDSEKKAQLSTHLNFCQPNRDISRSQNLLRASRSKTMVVRVRYLC